MALNAALGGLAIGVAVASASVGGFTLATVAGANIGQAAGMTVSGLIVAANSNITSNSNTTAASVGIGLLAANAAAAIDDVNPTIAASVGTGARVAVTGNVTVNAISAASCAVGGHHREPVDGGCAGTLDCGGEPDANDHGRHSPRLDRQRRRECHASCPGKLRRLRQLRKTTR